MRILVFLLLVLLLPLVSQAGEKINFHYDMVMRHCDFEFQGETSCVGDFSSPEILTIEMKDINEYWATGEWEKNYSIGETKFKGMIGVIQLKNENSYYIQLRIFGENFDIRSGMTVRNLNDFVTFEVKDDNLRIKSDTDLKLSPTLYIKSM